MSQQNANILPPTINNTIHSHTNHIFSIPALSHPDIPSNAVSKGGMLQTPYASSSEDSPSPQTPPISDTSSNGSPHPTPSPNIQSLAFPQLVNGTANTNAKNSDTALCAAGRDAYSPQPKLEADNAPIQHTEVVLMQPSPSQQSIASQANANTGKGGCWTCRIRRKKCDEQRTNDSCQTCIRLRIDCLGWGPKRPQWMRDKQAVEQYKAGIKEKLIKAGMVRGQPRLSQNNAARSSTLPSGAQTPSGSTAQMQYGHPHAASRSMSGPAAFGGLGGMGSIGPMSAFGVMGGSMPGNGMGFDFNQQHFAAQHPQSQAHSVRYGPYPSPRSLHGFTSPDLTTQQQHGLQIPQASSVMGPEFDYLSIPDQRETEQHQQHISRRASFGVSPSHQRNSQQQENRRRSLVYTSSPSLTGGSSSSHSNSPYISGRSHLSASYGVQTPGQGTLVDFPNDIFANMGSNMGSDMGNVPSGTSGLTVPGMNSFTGIPGVSSSPSLISGDESMLYSGATYAAPPSRSSSASGPMSSTAPSRSNSTPSTGYGDPLSDPSLVDPHVQYYFASIVPMQYAFASDKARSVLQNLFAREPFGALVNSSCALAAKHNKTIRVARLLDPPDADPQQSTAQQFFDRACWQLANATQSSDISGAAPRSVADALASLHLVAYFLLQGGTGAWSVHLDMARDWLAHTALCAAENEAPIKTLEVMDEAEQLAAKMTIWYDVFAAISQRQSPRFLATYRRLFGSIISREASDQPTQGIDMGAIMGCPEDILLILAETAELAHWKAQQRQLGTLSNRYLLRHGVDIEDRLLVSTVAESTKRNPSAGIGSSNPATRSQMHPTRPSGEHGVPSPATSTVQLGQVSTVSTLIDATGAAHSSVASNSSFAPMGGSGEPDAAGMEGFAASLPSFMTDTNEDSTNAPAKKHPADVKQRVARVYLHTASLYLTSVINEPSTSILDVNNAVNAVVDDLSNLANVPVDRMLALPLTLAGCLTDVPQQRHLIRSRLGALDDVVGNIRSIRLLMERVWNLRDTHGTVVDWLDVMHNDFGVEILLV